MVPVLYDGPISFDVLRTANNPGYYYSGALIDMGVTLTASAVDKDTFLAKARVTEYDGSIQGSFGNYGWYPEKESYALGDGWARWNIVDAYVSDADGNRVEKGEYVKIDIEWVTRTEPNGASSANRCDVPATRAEWYTAGAYIAYASINLDITQKTVIPGIAAASYVQDETRHDPIFDQFEILVAPGGGKYALYTPNNASVDNKRHLITSVTENKIDFAAANLPTTLTNLLAAGVNAKMKLYPAGPVFDGNHYFGAHDAWNYIYNNIVEDEDGETIFEWLASQSR